MASASGDVVPRQQKRKPKNKNTAAQLSAKHGYSPSKKGKTRQDDAPAPIQTRTAFPRKLQFASSNWKLLQEVRCLKLVILTLTLHSQRVSERLSHRL